MKNAEISPGEVGILALHGGFAEHQAILAKLGVKAVLVRNLVELEQVKRLIIPGGESTVISQFLTKYGLRDRIVERVKNGDLSLFGTCAGAIILAREVIGDQKVDPLGLIDLAVSRNAYGRQIASFTTDLDFEGGKLATMFIRAPKLENLGSNVQVLATYQADPVIVRSGNVLLATCHPELVGESGLHAFWLGNRNNAGGDDR